MDISKIAPTILLYVIGFLLLGIALFCFYKLIKFVVIKASKLCFWISRLSTSAILSFIIFHFILKDKYVIVFFIGWAIISFLLFYYSKSIHHKLSQWIIYGIFSILNGYAIGRVILMFINEKYGVLSLSKSIFIYIFAIIGFFFFLLLGKEEYDM